MHTNVLRKRQLGKLKKNIKNIFNNKFILIRILFLLSMIHFFQFKIVLLSVIDEIIP